MKALHLCLVLCLAWSTTTSRAAPPSQPAQPRNVLLIVVDDLGWTDLGCYGSSFYESPAIDSLARRGQRFTNAYSSCQVCSPSRASLLTGKYPARMRTTDYFGAPQPEAFRNIPAFADRAVLPAPYLEQLPLAETTLPEALKPHGYRTFFAGKWHLGPEPFFPEHQGFDINIAGHASGGPYGGRKYFSPYGNPRLKDGPPGEHLPDRLARETGAFIRDCAQRGQSFFAELAFYSVHTPLMGRPDLVEKFSRKAAALPAATQAPALFPMGGSKLRGRQNHAVYAAMVAAMDQAVGTVMRALDESGSTADTLLIFTSDNGGLASSEGRPTSNLPLRGGKGWIYEGGIRVPLIITGPRIPAGINDTPACGTDIYPTVLAALGLPPMPAQATDGIDLGPSLRGGEPPERPLFWHYPHWGNQGGFPSGAIRLGRWKLLQDYRDMHIELYDLAADAGEQHDLAAAQPQQAAHLLKLLEDFRRESGALMPLHR